MRSSQAFIRPTTYCSTVIRLRDMEALDHIYTADARILPPGAEMIHGVAAIVTDSSLNWVRLRYKSSFEVDIVFFQKSTDGSHAPDGSL
jgi:hypothetical protein